MFAFCCPSFRFDLDCSRLSCTTCSAVLHQWSLNAWYWPGSPSVITYIFDQGLFEMWDILQKKMPGTSENSFIRGLEDFSSSRGRVSYLIIILTDNHSFLEAPQFICILYTVICGCFVGVDNYNILLLKGHFSFCFRLQQ